MKLKQILERAKSGTEDLYHKDVEKPLDNWPGNKGDKSKLRGAIQPPGKAAKRKKRSIWTKELDEAGGEEIDFYDDGQDAWTSGKIISKGDKETTIKYKDRFGKDQTSEVENKYLSNVIRPVKGENSPSEY